MTTPKTKKKKIKKTAKIKEAAKKSSSIIRDKSLKNRINTLKTCEIKAFTRSRGFKYILYCLDTNEALGWTNNLNECQALRVEGKPFSSYIKPFPINVTLVIDN